MHRWTTTANWRAKIGITRRTPWVPSSCVIVSGTMFVPLDNTTLANDSCGCARDTSWYSGTLVTWIPLAEGMAGTFRHSSSVWRHCRRWENFWMFSPRRHIHHAHGRTQNGERDSIFPPQFQRERGAREISVLSKISPTHQRVRGLGQWTEESSFHANSVANDVGDTHGNAPCHPPPNGTRVELKGLHRQRPLSWKYHLSLGTKEQWKNITTRIQRRTLRASARTCTIRPARGEPSRRAKPTTGPRRIRWIIEKSKRKELSASGVISRSL